jgi:hypothetical protein
VTAGNDIHCRASCASMKSVVGGIFVRIAWALFSCTETLELESMFPYAFGVARSRSTIIGASPK